AVQGRPGPLGEDIESYPHPGPHPYPIAVLLSRGPEAAADCHRRGQLLQLATERFTLCQLRNIADEDVRRCSRQAGHTRQPYEGTADGVGQVCLNTTRFREAAEQFEFRLRPAPAGEREGKVGVLEIPEAQAEEA